MPPKKANTLPAVPADTDMVGALRRVYAAHFARVAAEQEKRLDAARRRLSRRRAA